MKVIGIGGPSCSGKTTLARHLRLVLPNAAILYEDDFYRPEQELPLDSAGRENWDCPESFDLVQMRQCILDIKSSGELPDQETREEYNNNPGTYLLSCEQIAELQKQFATLDEPILLTDGILLFHRGSEVSDLFDLKIAFPFVKSELKERREARTGYTTTDGFWQDPPNYFEDLVWPEFVKYCQYLYTPHGEEFRELSKQARSDGLWMPTTTDMYSMIQEVMAKFTN